MSDSPPPGVAENAAVGAPQALTPATIAAVLADFHNWLTALAVLPAPEAPATAPPPGPDLYTLLSQMTALRQEVNLQTRAVRAQHEQTGETLQQLEQTVEMLRETPPVSLQDDQAATEESLRPLLKTLVDLYDALSLASREITRVRDGILPVLHVLVAGDREEELPDFLPPGPPTRTWWQRWLGGADSGDALGEAVQKHLVHWRERQAVAREAEAQQRRETLEKVRQTLVSLVTGYAMGLQRIERALQQHGLDAIETAGQSFDPEQMEVVEAVADSGLLAGEVIDEVRRGYLWNGRVFRYAQVRVARS